MKATLTKCPELVDHYKSMLIDFRKLFPSYNLTFSGVLHIGANVGEEAPVYAELGIARQVWFEANPEIYEILVENLKNCPGSNAVNFAIGDFNGEIVLHVSNNGSQSSSVLRLGTHRLEHPDVHFIKDIIVPIRRIDSLAESDSFMNGLDLLNLDIQGFELNALIGIGEYINQFKAVYTEVNKAHVYEDCVLIEDMDRYLKTAGFIRVETHWAPNKNWGDAFYVRKELIP